MTKPFTLPEIYLTGLPTGAVKDLVDRLGKMIAQGTYPVGAKIPMEAELIDQMGVSRTVVREAVKVLSAKGLVRTARRYGTRVQPFDNWSLMDPDVIRWHDPKSPMAARIYAESTQLRSIVEPEAAALAALNASPAQGELIMAAAQAINPVPHGLEGMLAADYTFHATILQATGNIMLGQMTGLIQALLQFAYPTGPATLENGKALKHNHISVAKAILAREPDKARTRMQAMLDQNRKVAKILSDAP